MISINSGATSVSLPDPQDWDVIKPRAQEIASTLDGGAVVSSWAKSLEGAAIEYLQWITEAQYLAVKALDEHATITEWTVAGPDGDVYTATIDIKSAVRRYKNGIKGRDLSMTITVVEALW
jgi:hypothetical protein